MRAAGIHGRLCMTRAQMGQHRQLFPKGGTLQGFEAAGNSPNKGDVPPFLQPCLPQRARPRVGIRHIITILIPLHTARQSPPHSQRHLRKHPMVSAGRFLLGARKASRTKTVQKPEPLFPSTQPCCTLSIRHCRPAASYHTLKLLQ